MQSIEGWYFTLYDVNQWRGTKLGGDRKKKQFQQKEPDKKVNGKNVTWKKVLIGSLKLFV